MSAFAFGYYPGCSGQGTSKEYETSTRAVCGALGITLKDIPDWNCCGSTPAHTFDSVLSAAFSARVFAQGETAGITDVITPCPSCLKNLRNALNHMEEPLFSARVEALTEKRLNLEHSVKSVLQVIVEDLGLEAVKARVRRPLKGMRVAPYYGCLMTRPAASMRFDDPENPTALDRLLEALGAEVLPFPLKTDCCGASFSIPARDVVPRLSGRILDMANRLGADAVVVACPLCQMNLDLRQGQINRKTGAGFHMPVPYFTQLMAWAFALPDADSAFHMLAVDVQPAFDCMRRRAVALEEEERKAAEAEAKKAAGLAKKEAGEKAAAAQAEAAPAQTSVPEAPAVRAADAAPSAEKAAPVRQQKAAPAPSSAKPAAKSVAQKPAAKAQPKKVAASGKSAKAPAAKKAAPKRGGKSGGGEA